MNMQRIKYRQFVTYFPQAEDVIVGELPLEENQQPSKAEEHVGRVMLVEVHG